MDSLVNAGLVLTAEQLELGRTAARVLADTARKNPLPPAWVAEPARIDRPLWTTMAELGLLGLGVAEELGGTLEQCLVAEEIGAALPTVPYTGTAVATAVLADHPLVGDVITGAVVVAPAWETFPDVIVPSRREALQLHGSAVSGTVAVPFGLDADVLLGFAGGVPLIVALDGVPREAVAGFDAIEPMATVALDGASATVLPAGALPVAAILTVLAAELLGTGRRALTDAVAFAKQRRQFGRPIGSFQAIKHMLADRHVQLDAARLLVHDAAIMGTAAAARTALVAACAAADAATGDALQTHGGIGFTWEHPSHVLLKRARARRSLLGSEATQLARLADLVIGAG